MPKVDVFIDKGCDKFERRFEIDWDDGAVTIITRKEIILRGRDGQSMVVPRRGEHARISRAVLREQGYSLG